MDWSLKQAVALQRSQNGIACTQDLASAVLRDATASKRLGWGSIQPRGIGIIAPYGSWEDST
eukprot:1943760-Prymnesium_polylepis.1